MTNLNVFDRDGNGIVLARSEIVRHLASQEVAVYGNDFNRSVAAYEECSDEELCDLWDFYGV